MNEAARKQRNQQRLNECFPKSEQTESLKRWVSTSWTMTHIEVTGISITEAKAGKRPAQVALEAEND